MRRIAIIAAMLAAANPAVAQVSAHSVVEGYEIASIDEKGVCFAVKFGESAKGTPIVYSYYFTVSGQTWQVAGFPDAGALPSDTATLDIAVDGTSVLARAAPVQNGDFMFPFEKLDEVLAYEAAIEQGETLSVHIAEANDRIDINLADLRAALAAVGDCLKEQG